MLNNIPFQIMKNDKCDMNIVSKRLANRKSQRFKLVSQKRVIQLLKEDAKNLTTELVLNGTLRTGSYTYKTYCVVSSYRFDVLFERPWHMWYRPAVNHVK